MDTLSTRGLGVYKGNGVLGSLFRIDEMKHTTLPQPVCHYLTLNSITLFQMCCLSLLDGTMELSLYMLAERNGKHKARVDWNFVGSQRLYSPSFFRTSQFFSKQFLVICIVS